jgi:cytochrome c-type biogenesis protein CcmE
MLKGKTKFIVAITVIAVAIAYLVYGGVNDTMIYYLTVQELKDRVPSVYQQKVRVSGNVVPGSIMNGVDGTLEFKIVDGEEIMDVKYKGIVPDIFKDGVEAVVEGLYTPDNIFLADLLLAKCPTKYESTDSLKRSENI